MEIYNISWQGLKRRNANEPESHGEFESCGERASAWIAWCQTQRSMVLRGGLSFLCFSFLVRSRKVSQRALSTWSCRVLFTLRARDLVFCEILPNESAQPSVTTCCNFLSPPACQNENNRKKIFYCLCSFGFSVCSGEIQNETDHY